MLPPDRPALRGPSGREPGRGPVSARVAGRYRRPALHNHILQAQFVQAPGSWLLGFIEGRQTELLQNFLGVAAELRRGTMNPPRCAGKPGRYARKAYQALAGLDCLEKTRCLEVWILEQLLWRAEGCGGNSQLVQQFQPLAGGSLQKGLGQQAVDPVDLPGALLQGGELFAGPWRLDRVHEQCPLLVVVDQGRDMAIPSLVGAPIRRHGAVVVG